MDGPLASRTPWQRLPPGLVAALAARLPAIVDAVAQEVTQTIDAGPGDAKVAQDARRGVRAAVERFVALVGTGDAALPAGVRETFVELGAAEAREDRPPETLQLALRTAARVLLRQTADALAQSRPLTTDDLVDLSDAITAFVDELVAATAEGLTLQLRELAGERDRRRRLLAELLVQGGAPQRAVQAAAEEIGWPGIDQVVTVLLPPDQTRQAQFRYRDEAVTLERARDTVLLLRQGPAAATDQLERALTGRSAVVGVAVDWARVPQAVRLTELAAQVAGPHGDQPVFAQDHLATLALRGEPVAFALLSERRLAPFAHLPAPARERLLLTLAAWLRHWGSRADVAAQLHVHPQTVSYRVRALRELLGDELDDAQTRFELALVLADATRG